MPETQQQYHPDLSRRRSALRSMRRKDTIGIILLGDEKVGKTALINRWIHDRFSEEYKPTVEDFHMKTVVSLNRRVNVTLVDIAGSGQFPTMDELYISKSDCVVFVYEVGNEKSVQSIKRYFNTSHGILKSKNKKVRYNVIGTKADTGRENSLNSQEIIGTEYFNELDEHPKQYITSAKTNSGVNGAFDDIVLNFVKSFRSDRQGAKMSTAKEIGEDISVVEERDPTEECCYSCYCPCFCF